MKVATRHKEALSHRPENVALLSDVLWPVGALLLWGLCSTEHAEHAQIRVCEKKHLMLLMGTVKCKYVGLL